LQGPLGTYEAIDTSSGASSGTGGGYISMKPSFKLPSSWTIETILLCPLPNTGTAHALLSSKNGTAHGVVTAGGESIGVLIEGEKCTSIPSAVEIKKKFHPFVSSGATLNGLKRGWHHMVITFEKEIETVYIDGESLGSVMGVPATSSVCYIGNAANFDKKMQMPFGTFCQFKIFGSALSAESVNDLYLKSATPQRP